MFFYSRCRLDFEWIINIKLRDFSMSVMAAIDVCCTDSLHSIGLRILTIIVSLFIASWATNIATSLFDRSRISSSWCSKTVLTVSIVYRFRIIKQKFSCNSSIFHTLPIHRLSRPLVSMSITGQNFADVFDMRKL